MADGREASIRSGSDDTSDDVVQRRNSDLGVDDGSDVAELDQVSSPARRDDGSDVAELDQGDGDEAEPLPSDTDAAGPLPSDPLEAGPTLSLPEVNFEEPDTDAVSNSPPWSRGRGSMLQVPGAEELPMEQEGEDEVEEPPEASPQVDEAAEEPPRTSTAAPPRRAPRWEADPSKPSTSRFSRAARQRTAADGEEDAKKKYFEGPNIKHLESRGKMRYACGNYQGAVDAFSTALKPDRNNVALLLRRGAAYMALTNYDLAISDSNRVLALDPANVQALTMRGASRRRVGDNDGCIDDCSKAIRLAAWNDQALVNRSAAWCALGDHARALEDCDAALRVNPRNAQAFVNRAATKCAMGDGKGAADDCTRALELSPGDESALANLIVARKLMGMNTDVDGANLVAMSKLADGADDLAVPEVRLPEKSPKARGAARPTTPRTTPKNDKAPATAARAAMAAASPAAAAARKPGGDALGKIDPLEEELTRCLLTPKGKRTQATIWAELADLVGAGDSMTARERAKSGIAAAAAGKAAAQAGTGRPVSKPSATGKAAAAAKPGVAAAGSKGGAPQAKKSLQKSFSAVRSTGKTVDELDRLGHSAFKNRDFATSVSHFTAALELEPMNASFLGCRALASLALGNYEAAVTDCTVALAVDPSNALAQMGLRQYQLREQQAKQHLDSEKAQAKRRLKQAGQEGPSNVNRRKGDKIASNSRVELTSGNSSTVSPSASDARSVTSAFTTAARPFGKAQRRNRSAESPTRLIPSTTRPSRSSSPAAGTGAEAKPESPPHTPVRGGVRGNMWYLPPPSPSSGRDPFALKKTLDRGKMLDGWVSQRTAEQELAKMRGAFADLTQLRRDLQWSRKRVDAAAVERFAFQIILHGKHKALCKTLRAYAYGGISEIELHAAVRKAGVPPSWLRDHEIELIFQHFDADATGVAITERIAAWLDAKAKLLLEEPEEDRIQHMQSLGIGFQELSEEFRALISHKADSVVSLDARSQTADDQSQLDDDVTGLPTDLHSPLSGGQATGVLAKGTFDRMPEEAGGIEEVAAEAEEGSSADVEGEAEAEETSGAVETPAEAETPAAAPDADEEAEAGVEFASELIIDAPEGQDLDGGEEEADEYAAIEDDYDEDAAAEEDEGDGDAHLDFTGLDSTDFYEGEFDGEHTAFDSELSARSRHPAFQASLRRLEQKEQWNDIVGRAYADSNAASFEQLSRHGISGAGASVVASLPRTGEADQAKVIKRLNNMGVIYTPPYVQRTERQHELISACLLESCVPPEEYKERMRCVAAVFDAFDQDRDGQVIHTEIMAIAKACRKLQTSENVSITSSAIGMLYKLDTITQGKADKQHFIAMLAPLLPKEMVLARATVATWLAGARTRTPLQAPIFSVEFRARILSRTKVFAGKKFYDIVQLMDENGVGLLDEDAVRRIIRAVLRVPRAEVSEYKVTDLFRCLRDPGCDFVYLEDFLHFLGGIEFFENSGLLSAKGGKKEDEWRPGRFAPLPKDQREDWAEAFDKAKLDSDAAAGSSLSQSVADRKYAEGQKYLAKNQLVQLRKTLTQGEQKSGGRRGWNPATTAKREEKLASLAGEMPNDLGVEIPLNITIASAQRNRPLFSTAEEEEAIRAEAIRRESRFKPRASFAWRPDWKPWGQDKTAKKEDERREWYSKERLPERYDHGADGTDYDYDEEAGEQYEEGLEEGAEYYEGEAEHHEEGAEEVLAGGAAGAEEEAAPEAPERPADQEGVGADATATPKAADEGGEHQESPAAEEAKPGEHADAP
eukprot:TRINITY_DN28561_c0_g2_i1.p1 TRINITY_DN28561_c0_g2~~TRINITY_DN28561_c0_g2_i1.p1  ORF type:complete len:1774 (+),score=500.40 TRINITY_DN28561_c0_g2_i1:198-5519(+)